MPCREQRSSGSLVLGLATAAFGCSIPSQVELGEAEGQVIYGDDTRHDVYEEDSRVLRRLALQSSVAFMAAEHLVRQPDGNLVVVADTLGHANNLCPGEAFVDQPTAATCSGILVDDQLVMTAGHCVSEDAACDDRLVVFDYAITDANRAATLDDDAIYRCKSIPLRVHGLDPSGGRHDFAFVELDRPAGAARRPVTLGPADPPPGSALAVIGYTSGLPVKIDAGGRLLLMRQCRDYFTLTSDTFQSSSGSGVFDEAGGLVGIFVRGSTDYEYVADKDCAVPRRIANAPDPAEAEHADTVAPAVAALCASGWPSARLCSASRPRVPDSQGRRSGSCSVEPVEAAGCTMIGPSRRDRAPTGALLAMLAMLLVQRAAAMFRTRRRDSAQ